MFPSGENGMGATTLAEDLPTHPGEGHTADNSTIVYGEEYNSTSAERLEKGLVPHYLHPSAFEPVPWGGQSMPGNTYSSFSRRTLATAPVPLWTWSFT